MFNRKHEKIEVCLIALLSFVFLSSMAFGQGTSAALSGTVQDASGGVLVGASVTARNVDTGVETRVTSNDRGVYNFASLQPGSYEILASSSGMAPARANVRLSLGIQSSLNLTMSVAGTVTEVQVTGVAESITLEASASTGNVLQEDIIQAVPILSNNAMESINLMGGVTRITTGSMTWNANEQQVAGVAAPMINVTRDGISVNEVRNPIGIAAASNVNQEVVGEMRIILSPVDAELGRGAGQIQMTTRSGSNTYHGSAVWNVQNTVLDAEDFSAKQSGNPPNWRNLNNYLLSLGGPIIKNRTFFFVNWEQQWNREKITTTATVLTPCARRGIYRYLSSDQGGWIPQALSPTNSFDANTGNMRSVEDNSGKPWAGGTVLNSGANNQDYTVTNVTLNYESVFGPLTADARNALAGTGAGGAYGDCSAIDPFMTNRMSNTAAGFGVRSFWTTGVYNSYYDLSGYVDRFTHGVYDGDRRIVEMPPPNYYYTGDGLNYAGHQWTKSVVANMASIWGGGDPDHRSITAKFDHNINSEHRLSGTFNWEYFNVADADRQWPEEYGAYMGTIDRIPYGFTLSATSSLRPTLLNEARFGLSRSDTWTYAPLEANDSARMKEVLQALLPTGAGSMFANTGVSGKEIIVGIGTSPLEFNTENGNTHPYGSRGNIPASWGGSDPRWTISDTVTWMKSAHSFKGGVEYRRQSSRQDYNGARAFGSSGALIDNPVVRGGLLGPSVNKRVGSLADAKTANLGWQNIYGSSADDSSNSQGTGNYAVPYAMMTYFSGSLRNTSQYFYAVPDPNSPYLTGSRWNDLAKGENRYVYTVANQEFSFFFKDDWKVTSDLTLNLGVRYEYYGVPHANDGRTIGLKGGASNVWGITQGGFDHWMSNRNYIIPERVPSGEIILPDAVTEYQYIGPDSPNSDQMIWNRDTNNFAPHIGFAWQLPWFGKGQTTLRGGWSVSYSQINDFNMYGIMVADVAAANTSYGEFYGAEREYMDIMDLPSILPIQPSGSVIPLGVRQLDSVEGTGSVVIEDIRNPYVHSLNMSLTRNIGHALTVDVRYIGTLGRNQISTVNLNSPNYISNDLYKELEIVRRGGQSDLLNSIIPPNSLWRGETGSDQLRSASNFGSMGGGGAWPMTQTNIALGQFGTVAGILGSTNGILGQNNPYVTSTTAGMLARAGCLPEHRDSTGKCTKGTPLNYFFANPQFGGDGAFPGLGWLFGEPSGAATLYYNSGALSNYHSLQAQVSLRPTRGLNFQATYTWSRNLANGGWTNLLGDRDYVLSNQHRSHMLTTFGTYELPFGARGFLFRDASGVFKKAVEGWQLSWITSMTSGAPLSVTGANTLWGNNFPILVRPDLWNNKSGKASWDWNRGLGNYFGDGNNYVKVLDTNICRESGNQNAATGLYDGLAPSLYGQCTSSWNMPYALALAVRDSAGNIVPDTYKTDTMGADGVLYKAGEDIIVFRSADQRDGASAMGNYKSGGMTAQGIFSFDLAMSKSIEFMEGKRFEIRVDAQNILNHATAVGTSPGNGEFGGRFMSINAPANMAINSAGTIGELVTKAGHRTFQARLRFSF